MPEVILPAPGEQPVLPRLPSPERSPTPEPSPDLRDGPLGPTRKRLREYLDDAKTLTEQMASVFETVELQATEIKALKKRLKAANARVRQICVENIALLGQNGALTSKLAEARSALVQPQAVDEDGIPAPAATRAELEAGLARLQQAAGLLAD